MPKLLKEITGVMLAACPLCSSSHLEIVDQGRGLFGLIKWTDFVRCPDCAAAFDISDNFIEIRFRFVPDPYSFFEEYFTDWVSYEITAQLGQWIRDNDARALSLLSGAPRHAWRVRIIIGSKAPMNRQRMEYDVAWDDPKTKREAAAQLANIRQMQRELRQVSREINQDMKEIRARYGRSREAQRKKDIEIQPYEQLKLSISDAIVELDGIKLNIESATTNVQ